MRQRECMFNKSITMAIFFTGMAFFMTSCSDSRPDRVTEISEEAVTKNATKGVLYKPSELALSMRRMYDNMKIVGDSIYSKKTFADSLVLGYEVILTAEATNPDEITDLYYGFARGWLLELDAFKADRTIENYHALMNACVNCHKSYCPGPIPKIQKLKIAPI